MQLSIRNKIILCYAILILMSISISLGIFFSSKDYITNKTFEEISLDSIESDNKAINAVLRDVLDTSKTIISSSIVQDGLIKFSWEEDLKIMNYLKETVNFKSAISSAYIVRQNGDKYYSEKKVFKNINYESVVNLPIYNKIVEKKGGYVVSLNACGLIDEKIQYISFFRIINSLKNFKPIGILCINVEFNKMFGMDYDDVDLLNDNSSVYIVKNNIDNIISKQAIADLFNKNDKFSEILREGKNNYVIVGIKNEGLNMSIIKCLSVYEVSIPLSAFTSIIALIIVISSLLIFFGSVWISNYISRPIKKLIESMDCVFNGKFNYVDSITTKDEIGRFQEVYNITIDKIQRLIKDVYEEQKALHKAELEITIAQIKPHFLYNTLNTISSLAVMGKTEEVSETINALGNFYKACLNNGDEIISLEKELQSIKSYQYIQQLRYKDLFDIEYDVSQEALDVNVPKMILQPLVENSIYHGIRENIIDGLIEIKAFVDEEFLYIEVIDNGKGMDNKKLQEVLLGKSVGINATKKRIKILCGETSEFKVDSALGEGTSVKIKIHRRL